MIPSAASSALASLSALRQQRKTPAPPPSHIIALIGALLVLTAVFGSGYFITSLYQSEVSAIRNRLEIPAHAMAHSTDAIARNGDAALRNIQAALSRAGKDQFASEALRQSIYYRDNVSVAISRIAVYDPAGHPILTSTDDPAAKGSVANYDFFRRQALAPGDGLLVSDLVPDPINGKAEIVLSRRVADSAGNLLGVAAVFIDAGYLQQIFDSLQMPAGTSITAFNRDGHVVVRTPPIHLGDTDSMIDFTNRPIYRTFRDGPPQGSFARFTTIVGENRFVAGVGGNNAPFIIAAGWDSRAALATWRQASLAITGATIIALAIALGLLGYLRRQICRNDGLLTKVTEAEQRQRNLMTALPDAVAIIGDSLKIEFANPAAERLYGYDLGEMNGLSLSEVMASEEKTDDTGAARRSLQTDAHGASIRVIQRMARRKDGTELPVEINTCCYHSSEGPKLISVIRDVTVRQANDIALRRSRESLARAQRMAALGNFDRDLHTGVLECSDEFLRIWAFDDASIQPTPDMLIERVHPQDRDAFVASRIAVMSGRPMPKAQFRILLPSGEERILYHEYSADFAADGSPTRLFGIVQDITEQKHAEMALHRSRENLARAQRIASIGSFDRDLVTGRSEWSEEFLKIWGLDEMPAANRTEFLAELVHPDDRERFLEGRGAAIRNEHIPPLDFRITRPDGEVRFLHREYGVLLDESGRAVRLFGTVQDITERKRIETDLRQSREDLARAQQIAAIGSFSRELATNKTEWSDEFLRIWGIAGQLQRPSAEMLAAMVHPADRPAFLQGRDAALLNKGVMALDFRMTRPDGAERILHREYGVLFDDNGKAVRMFGTVQDVTERRKAEIELRRSRENMARAQRLACIGSFERDLVTGSWEWTDEMYRILGIEEIGTRPKPEELIQMIHPDDRERFQKARADELAGKPIAPFEYRITRRDGAERVVRRESAVTFDAENRPIRLFGTLQDITERKRAESEILQGRESMMRAQRIANMGSFDHDLATGRIEWSDQLYRIIGVEKDKVIPSADLTLQFVHPDDREAFVSANKRALHANSDAFEFRIVLPDGQERVLRRECDVHYAEDGRPTRVFGTVQDVTERRVAEARELELERQLLHSQKLEALGTLAGGIAHDLNNTLVPIMALSKLTARRFEQGSPVRSNLETIYEASERARDLVRRVLAFSRKDEPEQHETNLGDVVREALKLMRATVPTSIQLEAAIADVPTIRADASQIHQVITNLISNAAGAMNNGMGAITVSLTRAPRTKDANDVRLSVIDTGCGMDEPTMQRIFEPFFTTKAVGQGTGLGLSIVHGIVASHGGHIEVKSAPGKGTRFDLYFPLPAAEVAAAEEPSKSARPAA